MSQQEHHKVHTPCQKAVKRRRRSSETDRTRSHGGKRDRHRPQNKRAKLGGGGASKIVSSTSVANTIMKLRLGGSVSDPLNLEGYTGEYECSTCAPSPTLEDAGQPSPLPAHLQRDPLNLEGKVKDFPAKTRGGDRHGGWRSFVVDHLSRIVFCCTTTIISIVSALLYSYVIDGTNIGLYSGKQSKPLWWMGVQIMIFVVMLMHVLHSLRT